MTEDDTFLARVTSPYEQVKNEILEDFFAPTQPY